MNFTLLTILIAAAGVLLIAETLGLPLVLSLKFKGDVKRETQWLAQYGQAICTGFVSLVVWRLDNIHKHAASIIILAVVAASVAAFLLKRIFGRVRPGREKAGKFLGPTLRHANWRESFPSSHSAAAVALSSVLAAFYPQAAAVFWTLAICCAALRYIMDAHWPSDVLAGIALGYGCAHLVVMQFMK